MVEHENSFHVDSQNMCVALQPHHVNIFGFPKTHVFSGSPEKDRLREIISGMLSGFACKCFEYPFDTVKVLQQTSPEKYGLMSAPQVVSKTYYEGGFRSLYQGVTSPLIGAMMENSILFFAYGSMKHALDVDQNPSLSKPVPMWKYLVSGGCSGVLSAFLLTPVELVKCRLQIQQGSASKDYKGPIDVVVKTIRSSGFQGLWKGTLSCLVREVPGNMAWFGTYETVRYFFQRQFQYETMNEVSLGCTAIAGAISGIAYWAIPFPADSIKSRIQTDPAFSKLGFLQTYNKIVADQGFLSLYRGLGVTCFRAAPSHALIFIVYEFVSDALRKL